jgi:hypothetical protein
MASIDSAEHPGSHLKRNTGPSRLPPVRRLRIPIWLPKKFEADFEFRFCASCAEHLDGDGIIPHRQARSHFLRGFERPLSVRSIVGPSLFSARLFKGGKKVNSSDGVGARLNNLTGDRSALNGP